MSANRWETRLDQPFRIKRCLCADCIRQRPQRRWELIRHVAVTKETLRKAFEKNGEPIGDETSADITARLTRSRTRKGT